MFVNLLLKLNSTSTSKVLSLNINILFGLSSDKMKIKLDCSKGSICLILNGITKINNIKPLLGNDLYRNIKKLFYSFSFYLKLQMICLDSYYKYKMYFPLRY